MSDYDQQLADQVQMEFELDEVFKDLEEGVFFFQAEDGIRDFCLSRGLGDVYKRQKLTVYRLDTIRGFPSSVFSGWPESSSPCNSQVNTTLCMILVSPAHSVAWWPRSIIEYKRAMCRPAGAILNSLLLSEIIIL